LANVLVPNNQIVWYTTQTGGIPLSGTNLLPDGNHILYAAQKAGECESIDRTPVQINIGSTTDAPKAISPQFFNTENNVTVAHLNATGTCILWYEAPIGGEPLALTTRLTDSTTYYASQSSGSCESAARTAVTVISRYDVIFNTQGSSTVAIEKVVTRNKATRPADDPILEGYIFAGWYKEAACTNVWNFDTDVVTGNTTLYAKWTVMLANLTVSAGTLSPEFRQNEYVYRVTVPKSVESIVLTAIPIDGATVSGDGQKYLNTGLNTFEITTTSEKRESVYTIHITRTTNDYWLELIRSTEIKTGSILATYTTYVDNVTTEVTTPVIDQYKLEYELSTGNFSGTLPLHFDIDIESGQNTYNTIVSVNANSIYKMTLYLNMYYLMGSRTISFTTHFDIYGRPSYTTLDYNYYLHNMIASDDNDVLSTDEINITGDGIKNISLSDFTFIGNSTSVEELSVTPTIAIYPNPAADFITITGLQGDETLHFYTINGQLLFSHKATGKTENIPVGHLPAGIYFVKTSNGQTLKWVKK
jgi:uncharacterized repeat protein (TIGR02543 family)